LWAWFIVSAFALPALGVAQSIGICMTVRYITFFPTAAKDTRTDTEKIIEGLVYSLGMPLMALAFGAIVKSFI
jgi:hypothetical protein